MFHSLKGHTYVYCTDVYIVTDQASGPSYHFVGVCLSQSQVAPVVTAQPSSHNPKLLPSCPWGSLLEIPSLWHATICENTLELPCLPEYSLPVPDSIQDYPYIFPTVPLVGHTSKQVEPLDLAT